MLDVRKELLCADVEDLLSRILFEAVPHVFNGAWDVYRTWRRTLAHSLGVDPSEVILTGSAAVGVSLSPTKNFKLFDDDSDVDVAIVSDHFFSEAWHHLRTVDLTLDPLNPRQRIAVVDHQKRYVYWGCVATDRLLPILPFAQPWLAARAQLAQMAPTTEREINFRIYKDFRALRSYQLSGLKKLQAALLHSEEQSNAELS